MWSICSRKPNVNKIMDDFPRFYFSKKIIKLFDLIFGFIRAKRSPPKFLVSEGHDSTCHTLTHSHTPSPSLSILQPVLSVYVRFSNQASRHAVSARGRYLCGRIYPAPRKSCQMSRDPRVMHVLIKDLNNIKSQEERRDRRSRSPTVIPGPMI